jgi:hypothetical protein
LTHTRAHKKHLRPKHTAKIRVGNGLVRFINDATRCLGVWIDAHLTFKDHRNRCMKKAMAPEPRLRSLTQTYGVVPACVSAVQIASIQEAALHGCELWRDPKEGSRRDNLQLPLYHQARFLLGALPTTPRGAHLGYSRLRPPAVALDPRQQLFVVRLANECVGSKLKELFEHPIPGAPVGTVAAIEYACGMRAETMRWPDPA